MTEKRLIKIKNVVGRRQKNLTLVLENIHDPHNVSAIFRSADAVGIDRVFLIYNSNKFPKIGRVSSASANKWVSVNKFKSVKDCYDALKKEKFFIYATHLSGATEKKSLYDLDLCQNTAIVLGNEHAGVSDEAAKMADGNFEIPMYGMVQSLNVSVSAAVCLFEALRQRELKGMYEESLYTKPELEEKLNLYLSK